MKQRAFHIFLTFVFVLALASMALAVPTARLSPPSVTLAANQQGSVDIIVTADAPISSVTVEGTFVPAAVTPTVQVTVSGPIEPWGDQGSDVIGSTWRLVASRGGKVANKLPAGTHTIGRISFTASASTTLTMTSALVGTSPVQAANLAGTTITVQAAEDIQDDTLESTPLCTAANWQMGAWSSCAGACGGQGTQTRMVTKSGDCQGGAVEPATSQSCTTAPCPTETGRKQQLITQIQNIPENEVPSSWTAQFISRLAGILKSIFG